jgi:hypothetical protein
VHRAGTEYLSSATDISTEWAVSQQVDQQVKGKGSQGEGTHRHRAKKAAGAVRQ